MHGKALVLANLPEDPPPSDGLRIMPIQEGDYRTGLLPSQVTCHTDTLSSTRRGHTNG